MFWSLKGFIFNYDATTCRPFLFNFDAPWNPFQLWYNPGSCETHHFASVILMTTTVTTIHLLTEWFLIICILCLHVSVMSLSGSNTWLHCQGETYRGQYTTVFRLSSYCGRLVDCCYFFPLWRILLQNFSFISFSVNSAKNTSSGRKKNCHLELP